MERIIVTGSAGFVGTNVSLKLLNEGYEIVGIYHNRRPRVTHKNFKPIQADLSDREQCHRVLAQQADGIVMAAAYVGGAEQLLEHPMRFVTDTTVINLYVLESALMNGIKKVIYVSSGMVYPDSREPLVEEWGLDGDPYEKYFFGGWSRRYTEIVCRMYAEKIPKTMDITVLRIDNLYGPYDSFKREKSHVMAALIRKAVERMDPFEVWGDGKDYKDFIYIDDLVQGVYLALKSCKGLHIYNIASGVNHTINEVLSIILEEADYKDADIKYNTSKPMMIPYKRMNIEKAKNEIGFNPQVSIREGIRRTIEWYRTEGYKTV